MLFMDDGGSPTFGIIIFAILVLFNAIIFGFLAAMENINETALEKYAEEGNKRAKLILRYADKPNRFKHVCQLMFLLLTMLAGFTQIDLWKNYFFQAESGFVISVLENILIFVIVLLIMLVIGVFTPQKIAARKSERWVLALIMPIRMLEIVFTPFIFLIDQLSNLFSRLFGVDPLLDTDDVTEEEIISMVNEGHEQGVLLASEAEMIHNIFEFGDKEAKDIMTHRKNIVAIDANMKYIDVLGFLKENNYSRFPVYEEDIDNIIGVLHIKEALDCSQEQDLLEKPIKDIKGLIRETEFIPETRNINMLFTTMQSQKNHMVIVVDEYGQTSGIVAMEDILEEIVGNIEDEHDAEELLIEKLEDGSYRMNGMAPLEDVAEVLGITLEDDDFETLNGFLISLIDKIPNEDEHLSADAFGYHFEIQHVENKMIQNVKVTKLPEDASEQKIEDACQEEEMMIE